MNAKYEVRDAIAVVTLDNPPVNALSLATRRDVVAGVDAARRDASVRAIVIIGAGRMFSGGADIAELGTPQAAQEPTLRTVLEALEGSRKPVVAALHGAALGGGLELALAVNYRIAAQGTSVGLPEVKIGILPGAGGTQRLPRAIGLERALDMVLSGKPVKCEQLEGTRLLDAFAQDDLLTFACSFARAVAVCDTSHPRVRDWKVEAPPNAAALLEAAHLGLGDGEQSLAHRRCLEALRAAISSTFEAGLAVESAALAELAQSPSSRALRHIFFAERAARKVPGIAAEVARRSIERVAVIGAGTMGTGIVICFLDAGIPVTLIETNEEALGRGLETIRARYRSAVSKGRLRSDEMERRLDALQPTTAMAEAGAADLVIEAVYEDYSAKERVFRLLDDLLEPGAIMATNTSTLDVDRIAAVTARPQDVLGMHFFSPANVMKLLELVRGKRTAPGVLATAMDVAARIGKVAVVAGVCDGFIGNRMLEQYVRQAGFLLDEGLLPQQIDRAIEGFGFAMGPFRMNDLAGNDISWAIRKRRRQENPRFTYSATGDLICEIGRFGQKCGAGWYDYEPGDRTAHPSAEVAALLAAHVRALGVPRHPIGELEIVERLVFALINEGAEILEEGIAARASDIDLVYLNGYGFPRLRGGPMFYADTVGLRNVLQSIHRFAQGYQGESWVPAPLLCRLAGVGGRFNQ